MLVAERHKPGSQPLEHRPQPRQAGPVLRTTGYDADAGWLDCLAYVWRPESRDAVWALERWERARNVLLLYTRDEGFDPQALDGIHRRLRECGDDAVAEQVREILARG